MLSVGLKCSQVNAIDVGLGPSERLSFQSVHITLEHNQVEATATRSIQGQFERHLSTRQQPSVARFPKCLRPQDQLSMADRQLLVRAPRMQLVGEEPTVTGNGALAE
jgi:hypothetical protein